MVANTNAASAHPQAGVKSLIIVVSLSFLSDEQETMANVMKEHLVSISQLAQQQSLLQGLANPAIIRPLTSWSYPDQHVLQQSNLSALYAIVWMCAWLRTTTIARRTSSDRLSVSGDRSWTTQHCPPQPWRCFSTEGPFYALS